MLLLGHKKLNSKREWGVPGGLKDRSDPDASYTAVREFLEETGIKAHPTPLDVAAAMSKMMRHGSVQNIVPPNRSGFSAYGLVFDNAKQFEKEIGLTKMLKDSGVRGTPTIQHRYEVEMSRETKGYTYVPIQPIVVGQPATLGTVLPTFLVTANPAPYRAVRPAPGITARHGPVRQLKLRRGVSDRAMRGTRAML
jgi:8-oxo-dGTP pyrophosphatase MutT (NUDIX family)